MAYVGSESFGILFVKRQKFVANSRGLRLESRQPGKLQIVVELDRRDAWKMQDRWLLREDFPCSDRHITAFLKTAEVHIAVFLAKFDKIFF